MLGSTRHQTHTDEKGGKTQNGHWSGRYFIASGHLETIAKTKARSGKVYLCRYNSESSVKE